MARGFPSMTALLALLAVAGYQNRDKLAQVLGGHGGQQAQPGQPQGGVGGMGGALGGGLGGILGSLRGAFGGAGAGGLIGNGVRELMERFQQNGKGDVAQSWVSTGPNRDIAPHELESAIGHDVLADLSQKTGLSKEDLLQRLSRELPTAVDKYTPDGNIPTDV
jgi:uncharacterized protein YidB (DUF937 family)